MSQSDMYTIADDLIGLVGEFPLQNIDAESFGKEHGVSADHVVKIGHWCKQNGYMTESSHSDMQHAIWCGMLTAEGEEVAAGRATTHPDKTPTQASTTNFNFNGSVTAGMIGSNNTQNVTLTVSEAQVLALAEALRRDGHDTEADTVLDATDNGKNPNKLLDAFTSIGPALSGYGSFVATLLSMFAGAQ
ncbi:hypothetical protein [Corynebacterium belfantii]|uniref:Uncharacterized protein n=2 Tax=Corynebacterium belfantii TaxID=2014537 RepID=A0ABS0LBW7_9CORY|nr:hypothetical protein [Corynebacterium belfantii]OWM36626.1 hypothetical protein AZF07_01135 [Corynebacterium diphtheriae subsp. lausannense]MBG9243532.1 hypothetical protein [Corynebacterium belfantii]MBG9309505.1 hypothetical protein [Corynebacterium belfantii]MBG9325664.1 hypothetical protein [Corynebacterium belfantii]MBG9330725.1 hypothetical protein [Corynebacterium belfantii]